MKNRHYGWTVCFAATCLLFITIGSVSNGFSVYLPFIMEEKGLTHAQTSNLLTLRALVSFIVMLGIGWYYRVFSLRVGMTIASACAGAAFLIYSLAETYPAFCAGASVAGLSYGLGSMIPASILIERWFARHRALALSICSAGSGVATVVLPPAATKLKESLSMAAAFRIEAVFLLALTVMIFLLLRNDPSEKGLTPYGSEEETGREEGSLNHMGASGRSGSFHGGSFSLTRPVWILMIIASLLIGAIGNPGFNHLSVLFTSAGYSPMLIAGAISAIGLILTAGKVVYGEITDRLKGLKSTLFFGGILLAGHILCCLVHSENRIQCAAIVLLLGIGYPATTIGPSIWAGDLTSSDHFDTAVRRLQIAYAGGALLFSSMPGVLADHFNGSYIPAYIVFTSVLFLTLILVAASYRLQAAKLQKAAGGKVL